MWNNGQLPEQMVEKRICPHCGLMLNELWICPQGFDASIYVVPPLSPPEGQDDGSSE